MSDKREDIKETIKSDPEEVKDPKTEPASDKGEPIEEKETADTTELVETAEPVKQTEPAKPAETVKTAESKKRTEPAAEEQNGPGRSRARRSRKKNAAQIQEPSVLETKAPSQNAAVKAEDGQSSKKLSAKKIGLIAGGVLAAVLIVVGASYGILSQKYKRVFFPNTQINGMEVSGKSIDEVKALISEGIEGYVLQIEALGDESETLTGEEIDLHAEFNGSLEQILEVQNPYEWPSYWLNPASYTIDTLVVYDEDALDARILELDCMDPEQMITAEDAKISDYTPGQGYSIIPETAGTVISEEALKNGIRTAVMNLQETLSLEETGCYIEPAVKQDDPALLERLETMNRMAGVTITYQFGDQSEVLNGDRTHQWIVVNEDGVPDLDVTQIAAYVEELAVTYNTSNKAKTLKTSYGPTIQVSGGFYGWRINQAAETEALAAAVRSGESQNREPVYSQSGASRGANDYGDTYVEINLTAQHLFLYKNGNLVVESDFVSGNLARGWGTPVGTYPLTYKQRNATLKGEGYRTPVDYWMPFNGGVGMHDAKWRSSFGGTIYKNGGSHGCINLPHSVAKTIYENFEAGMPVLCYNLPGTEQAGSAAVTPPPTEAPDPILTEPESILPEEPTTEMPIPQGPGDVGQTLPVAPTEGSQVNPGPVVPDGSPGGSVGGPSGNPGQTPSPETPQGPVQPSGDPVPAGPGVSGNPGSDSPV